MTKILGLCSVIPPLVFEKGGDIHIVTTKRRSATMTVTKFLLASASFTAGLFIGAIFLLPILAHAAEYTAVGRDNTGEMVLVEFDETDRNGNLAGLMWRRLEVVEVDGKWCGKGRANFEGVKVEVVK